MAYKPLIIDFETYYGVGYSLRTIPTIPYIMDERFDVHGMAVFDLETGLNDWIGAGDVRQFLKDASFSKRAVIAHNAPFDLGIVRYRYGMLPGAAVCTMQMAFRVLGNRLGNFDLDTVADYLRVGSKIKGVLGSTKGKHWDDLTPDEQAKMIEYSIQDVSLCYRIFAVMKPQMTRDAFEDLDWHIRVGLDAPFAADTELLEQAIDEEEQRIAEMVAELGVEMRAVRSAAKFADLLRSIGVEPPMKWSAKQGKNIPAVSKTDREFRRIQMEHPDERVRKLCTLRLELASNSARTKLMRMKELARVTGGEMPVLVNYCGALQTGRPSGRDRINQLNMARKSTVRKAVIAKPGEVLVGADLSGAELRACRWLCQDPLSIEVLSSGGDLYKTFWAESFGVPLDEVTDDLRFYAKVASLSLQYSTGAEKLRNTIWAWSGETISEELAQELVEKFRYETHKPVADYWSYLQKTVIPTLAHASDDLNIPLRGLSAVRITKHGLVMPDGFVIKYPYLRQETNDESGYTEWVFDKKGGRMQGRIYGGAMLENLSQALVNVIISEKMRRLRRMGWRAGLSVYDEIVLTAPTRRADEAAEVLRQVMVERVEWWPELPLEADVHVGHTYYDLK